MCDGVDFDILVLVNFLIAISLPSDKWYKTRFVGQTLLYNLATYVYVRVVPSTNRISILFYTMPSMYLYVPYYQWHQCVSRAWFIYLQVDK